MRAPPIPGADASGAVWQSPAGGPPPQFDPQRRSSLDPRAPGPRNMWSALPRTSPAPARSASGPRAACLAQKVSQLRHRQPRPRSSSALEVRPGVRGAAWRQGSRHHLTARAQSAAAPPSGLEQQMQELDKLLVRLARRACWVLARNHPAAAAPVAARSPRRAPRQRARPPAWHHRWRNRTHFGRSARRSRQGVLWFVLPGTPEKLTSPQPPAGKPSPHHRRRCPSGHTRWRSCA